MADRIDCNAAPIGLIGAAVVLDLLLVSAVFASPDGAEWETAEDPIGCQQCHLGSPDPADSQALAIEGLPKRPEADERYELTIVLSDPALRNAGFLLSILSDGSPAGEFSAVDDRTETNGAQARSTYESTTPDEPGNASWQLIWTTPAVLEEPLRFELWGNAGNYDLSPLGDRLHHQSWHLLPSP